MTLALSLLIGLAFAEENPIRGYLGDPNIKMFREAVNYLVEQDGGSEEDLKNQITLAFLANLEAKRIMELAVQRMEKLSAGERFSLGNLYLSRDDYAQSIKIYESLNKEFPKWSCPWRHKGEALYKMKDFKASAKALEMSIETNLEHVDAYIWYAFALNELKQYKKARTALEKAFELQGKEEEGSHFDEELPEAKINALYDQLKKKTK